ncbi:SpoIIAA-like protein [Pontibacter korlensis]
MGGNHILSMLQEKPCLGILSSNKELIGPWDSAISWLVYKWAPQAKELGLRYYAHVLSPGIYGQRSFQSLYPLFREYFNLRSFNDEQAAEEWLLIWTS